MFNFLNYKFELVDRFILLRQTTGELPLLVFIFFLKYLFFSDNQIFQVNFNTYRQTNSR